MAIEETMLVRFSANEQEKLLKMLTRRAISLREWPASQT